MKWTINLMVHMRFMQKIQHQTLFFPSFPHVFPRFPHFSQVFPIFPHVSTILWASKSQVLEELPQKFGFQPNAAATAPAGKVAGLVFSSLKAAFIY